VENTPCLGQQILKKLIRRYLLRELASGEAMRSLNTSKIFKRKGGVVCPAWI
jgi:hypothetical protein